jgi:hypothetical protein
LSLLKHSVYRAYIALARGEHFTPSELGDCLYDDCPESLLVQENWWHCEKLGQKLGLDYIEMFDQMIIAKPSKIEHIIYMGEIRKIAPDFEIKLPPGHGYLIPLKNGHLIDRLEFKQLWY